MLTLRCQLNIHLETLHRWLDIEIWVQGADLSGTINQARQHTDGVKTTRLGETTKGGKADFEED